MPSCLRCGSLNLEPNQPHTFHREPCSGIPRSAHVDSHGAYHQRCRDSADAFAGLNYIGQQQTITAELGLPGVLLMGNCMLDDCHSTICRWVEVGSPEQLAYAARGKRGRDAA